MKGRFSSRNAGGHARSVRSEVSGSEGALNQLLVGSFRVPQVLDVGQLHSRTVIWCFNIGDWGPPCWMIVNDSYSLPMR